MTKPERKIVKKVKVLYAEVDGAHFFTSFQVKGLIAASSDLEAAYNEVSLQLCELLGTKGTWQPSTSFEEFKAHLAASRPDDMIENAAVARWSETRMAA